MSAEFWIIMFIAKAILTFVFRKKIFALFKKRKPKKNSTLKNIPMPALEERSGFEDGVIG